MNQEKSLSDAFRRAFRHHPAGVAILTAEGRSGPVALTISSLVSVSAAPPIVAFSLSAASRTSEEILQAGKLVIHFPRYAEQNLAQLCATRGSDRFGEGIEWGRLPTGEPRYLSVTTWFRARLRDVLPVDGAALVTAELLEGEVEATDDAIGAETLIYCDRKWHSLGNGLACSAV